VREFFEAYFQNRYLERDSIFIVYVQEAEEIARIIDYANKNGCIIMPTTGGNDIFYDVSGSKMDIIVLNMSLMKKVRDFDMESGYIEVEPGITVGNLNRFFEKHNYNLFFPNIAYGSFDFTTIAGNIVAGSYSKYDFFAGKISTNVLGLNVMDVKGKSFFLEAKR
jgi:FAD/FMN-containing dehydrogenase